jgi:hypothetical protein
MRRVTVTAITVDAILAGGVVARAWSGYLAVLVRHAHVLANSSLAKAHARVVPSNSS